MEVRFRANKHTMDKILLRDKMH